MAMRKTFHSIRSGIALALLIAAQTGPVAATELVGRVVDATDARVFTNAQIQVRGNHLPSLGTQTDAQGFFRVSGLAPGSYLLDVNLADGRAFIARLVLLPHRKTQFLELDYSRAVPPDDDEDY